MRIYINELSFNGQAKSVEELHDLLAQLSAVAQKTKYLRGSNTIERHSCLFARKVFGDKTFNDLFGNLKSFQNKVILDKIRMFLLTYAKGPYFDRQLEKNFPNHNCRRTDTDEDVTNSCLAAAVLSPVKGAVISAQKSDNCNDRMLEVAYKNDAADTEYIRKIRNYTEDQDVEGDIWQYEPNPKHDPKTRSVKGKQWTHMDLLPETAQKILSCGIRLNNKEIYSSYQNKWYIFRNHHKNRYHGYPVQEQDVPDEILRIWQKISHNEGQTEI